MFGLNWARPSKNNWWEVHEIKNKARNQESKERIRKPVTLLVNSLSADSCEVTVSLSSSQQDVRAINQDTQTCTLNATVSNDRPEKSQKRVMISAPFVKENWGVNFKSQSPSLSGSMGISQRYPRTPPESLLEPK